MPRHYTRPIRSAIIPIGPSIAYIPLTQGLYAIVDREDAEWLQQSNWHAQWSGTSKSFYAVRNQRVGARKANKFKSFRMHREILGVDENSLPDHANGNTLDCRRANLRPASSSQNACNRIKPAHNKSGFKGVYFHKQSGSWRGQVCSNGKYYHCGNHRTPEMAFAARAAKAKELHGEFARLA